MSAKSILTATCNAVPLGVISLTFVRGHLSSILRQLMERFETANWRAVQPSDVQMLGLAL